MKKWILITVTLFCSHLSVGQALSVDEQLKSQRPFEYRARENQEYYLVLQKKHKRIKIHRGEPIYFKSQFDAYFQGEVSYVEPGYFKFIYFDPTSERYEERNMLLSEVVMLYKRPHQKFRLGLGAAGFVMPLIYDWIVFQIVPWQNYDSYPTMIAVAAAGTLMANRNKYFNKRRIAKKNWSLEVFQY